MPRSLDAYGDLCTQFYDLDKPEAPPDALEFYWRRFERTGGPALEVMCGSGRFLLPFAARGAEVDGADASPQMLAACRRRAAAAGLAPRLLEQFVQDLDMGRGYRFVFVPSHSFALVPRADQPRALRALARHLVPGGELVVEMVFRGAPAGVPVAALPERRVRRRDGAEIVLSADTAGRCRYDLVSEGRVLASEHERFVLHPTPREEFEAMLLDAGLRTVHALWPYGDEPARAGAPYAVHVCERIV